jgi:serine 3-dehydrogenase
MAERPDATRTAFITGATSGFGAATSRLLVADGWQVVGTGRRADRLAALHARLGDAFLGAAFDIRDEAALRSAFDALPARFRGIDLLVNNAGVGLGTDLAPEASLADWKATIETNVTALVTVTHLLLPTLIERRGTIVDLASTLANWPGPGNLVYAATKAFVRQFSLGLRSDLHGTGVRVTSLEPGLAETEFHMTRTGGGRETHDAYYGGAGALRPEDVAGAILWVASLPPHVNVTSLEIMPVSQSLGGVRTRREA